MLEVPKWLAHLGHLWAEGSRWSAHHEIQKYYQRASKAHATVLQHLIVQQLIDYLLDCLQVPWGPGKDPSD